MLKDTSVELTGNDRFEGYAIDLIEELSTILNFDYEIILQHDGNYGIHNNETKRWDGMIGKIIAGVIRNFACFKRFAFFIFVDCGLLLGSRLGNHRSHNDFRTNPSYRLLASHHEFGNRDFVQTAIEGRTIDVVIYDPVRQ